MASAPQDATTSDHKEGMETTHDENDKNEVDVLPEFSRKVSIRATTPMGDNPDTDDGDKDEGGKLMANNEKSLEEEKDVGFDKSGIDGSSSDKSILVQNPIVVESRAAYKCNCGESFEKSAELAAHKRWSCLLVEKKLQCDVCKSWFAHENSLRRHMKHSHEGDFSCTQCDLKFHNRIKLTRHWMEYHYDDKRDDKLKCFLCGEDSFKGKFELESHLLIHKYNRRHAKGKFGHGCMSHHRKWQKSGCVDLTESAERTSSSPSSPSTPTMSWYPPSHVSVPPHMGCSHSHPCWQSATTTDTSKADTTTTKPISTSRGDAADDVHESPSFHHYTHPPFPPHPHHPPHPHPHPHLPPHPHLHHHHPPFPPHPHPHHHHPPFSPHPHHHHPPPHSPPPPHTDPSFPPPPFWNSTSSPFTDSHQGFPFFGKHHRRKHHHDKWKWKKYFKSIMFQHFSPPWACGNYSDPRLSNQHPHSNVQSTENQSRSGSPGVSDSNMASNSVPFTPDPSDLDSERSSSTFKMICKFCDQVVEKGKATQHRLQDCPYICAFKCKVCDKVFKKRHKLIQHMIQFSHYLLDTTSDSNPTAADNSETSSISNLYKRLDSVLDLHNAAKGHTKSSSVDRDVAASSVCERTKDKDISGSGPSTAPDFVRGRSPPCPNPVRLQLHKVGETEMNDMSLEESNLVIDDGNLSPHAMPSPVSQCSLCRAIFDSVYLLCEHLQDHITHVTSVQKVHEWKEKSSGYFSDSTSFKKESAALSSSCPETSTDGASVSTADTSFLSMHTSTLSSTTVENSYLGGGADAITESEKWLKPHCKNKKKGKKRHANETFPCEHCDESFSFKKNLKCHIKEKHPEKKHKLECPVCLKKFSWEKRGQFFERHLSSHYGVTIFKHKCEFCDKTFLEKCKLRAHIAVQHKNADESLLHTCHLCGKGYGTKSSLTRHLRHHTGDKPHQCQICRMSFLEKRELTRHMAAHTGMPAFVCPQCGQGFTLKTSLDTHVKRKHSPSS